ncbi:MAG: hypothetical protein M1469_04690 [Bacteroidetes bacterium]|nr:hypothetical protein [Bacteroidota bacterium]
MKSRVLPELLKLRLKQTIRGEGFRGVLKFLAPDLLVGFFLALTAEGFSGGLFPGRVATVAFGVTLFTLIAETRKLFYNGGDIESFYFVQPTFAFRFSSASAIFLLDLMVSFSIFLPVILFSGVAQLYPGRMMLAFLTSSCLSASFYFLIMLIVSSLSKKILNPALTGIQLMMALTLLALFQLSAGLDIQFGSLGLLLASLAILLAMTFVFVVYPLAERLSYKLNWNNSSSHFDLVYILDRVKKLVLIRSPEENAGFMLFLSNILRNPSFRLSTIGIAATPVMVAVYWSMQSARFMTFHIFPGFVSSDLVAPLASLVVSAVLVHYFLSQNILSSVDHEAKWLIQTSGDFNAGKFVLGVRKSMLLTVHIPMTVLVFFVLVFENPPVIAVVSAVTFYLLSHVAASWFSVMQKTLPFSLPFTRLGAIEAVNLVFMLAYSLLVSVALFFSFGRLEKLLTVNLLAFILIGVLEISSTKIVNRRVKLSV